jgi:hypothetical protein
VTWPVAPVKGFITLSNAIREQAEEQQRSPATIRKKLEELPEEEQHAQMEELTQEWMESQQQGPRHSFS